MCLILFTPLCRSTPTRVPLGDLKDRPYCESAQLNTLAQFKTHLNTAKAQDVTIIERSFLVRR